MSRRRQYTPLQRKRIGYLMQPQFFLEEGRVSLGYGKDVSFRDIEAKKNQLPDLEQAV